MVSLLLLVALLQMMPTPNGSPETASTAALLSNSNSTTTTSTTTTTTPTTTTSTPTPTPTTTTPTGGPLLAPSAQESQVPQPGGGASGPQSAQGKPHHPLPHQTPTSSSTTTTTATPTPTTTSSTTTTTPTPTPASNSSSTTPTPSFLNRSNLSTEAWLVPGCEFSCCSCCPKIICACNMSSERCGRPLWHSIRPALRREAHLAIIKYCSLCFGLFGIIIMCWSLYTDLPELPRRTRKMNPMGHSEGSLCLLHTWQPQPIAVNLLNPSTQRLRTSATPVSVTELIPARKHLTWLAALSSPHPPKSLKSPCLPSMEEEPLGPDRRNEGPVTLLPTKLFLVGNNWGDRSAFLTLTPEELDSAFPVDE